MLGRTGLVTVAMGILLIAALWICVRSNGDAATKMFGDASIALVLLSTGMASKSALEGIATGTGLKGIGRAILTDAKPGQPESTTQVVTEKVEVTHDAEAK